MDNMNLASQLRACAEYLEKYDQAIWNAVLNELDEGSKHWAKNPIGHSYIELAQKEIRRLYALEKSVSQWVSEQPKKLDVAGVTSAEKITDRINLFLLQNPLLDRKVAELLMVARDEIQKE